MLHAIAFSVALVAGPAAQASTELKPGPFAGLPGTALDKPVEFENDIYLASCHPLYLASGREETEAGKRTVGPLLAFLHRGHVVGTRVFVEPCVPSVPLALSPARITGEVASSWYEATLIGKGWERQLALRPLNIEGWEAFSQPEFCQGYVAFWSARTEERVMGHVVDLFNRALRRSASLGKIDLAESDMGWGLPPITWNRQCTAASFRDHKGRTVMIAIPKQR